MGAIAERMAKQQNAKAPKTKSPAQVIALAIVASLLFGEWRVFAVLFSW